VAEALANVAKYADATRVTVSARHVNGYVSVTVVDDGVGGADATRGSGLRGLGDRVAALDGALSLESPAGAGTRLHAEIPARPRPPSASAPSSGRGQVAASDSGRSRSR
jgi:signal transduction histidine kinase